MVAMLKLYKIISYINRKGLRFSLSLFLLLTLSSVASGQNLKSEYIGAIITRGFKTMLYNIHINYNSKTSEIKGYSTTDLDKTNETICLISGKYDRKTNTLKFSEYKIQSTKSKAKPSEMCFIHFEGRLMQKNENAIRGKFKGKYPDGSHCAEGQIFLASKEVLVSTMDSVKKSNDTILNEFKKEIPMIVVIRGGQIRYIQAERDTIGISIWDDHKLDNDMIDLYVDGKLVESGIILSKKPVSFNLAILKNRTIKIKAKNIGFIAPNTAKIRISNGEKVLLLLNELDVHQVSEIVFTKK